MDNVTIFSFSYTAVSHLPRSQRIQLLSLVSYLLGINDGVSMLFEGQRRTPRLPSLLELQTAQSRTLVISEG
jgi:hypothetical protein